MNFLKRSFVPLVTFFALVLSVVNVQGKKSEKKIDFDLIFIGNSITYGAFVNNQKKDAPPAIASQYLRNKKEISSVSFVNQGRCGATTVDYLPANSAFKEVCNVAKEMHTDSAHLLVFSIKLGTNDSAIEGPTGSPVSRDNYRKNMKQIIDELLIRFPDSKIVLQQPIYYTQNTQNGAKYLAEGLTRLQTYFPELKSLVKSYSKTHKDRVFLGNQRCFDYFKINFQTDMAPENGKQGVFYLHPNKKGSFKLGEFWGESIYKVLK